MTKTTTKAKATTAKKTTTKRAPKAKAKGLIVSSAALGEDKHLVKADDGRELTLPTARWSGDIRQLSAVGEPFDKLEAAWAKANVTKLAKGVGSRDAPHSAKAIQDNRAKASKGQAKAAPKAKPAAKAKATKTAAGEDRAYTVLVKLADITLREGTWTEYMVKTALAHKSTAAADAALAKKPFDGKTRRIDWNWLANSRKYIKFA